MTARHATTDHPERYQHAPTSHPTINQNTFECMDCGTLVLDLERHDGLHDQLDGLAGVAKDTPAEPVSIISKIKEEPSARSSSTPATGPRKPTQKGTT